MRSLAIENFRRSELERWIDDAIDLLDAMDDDTDLEDDEIEDINVYAPARRLFGGGDRPMTDTARVKLDDDFGAARSFLHAIRLAAQGLSDRDMCALDLLGEKAEDELNKAQAIADTLLDVGPVDKSNNGEN